MANKDLISDSMNTVKNIFKENTAESDNKRILNSIIKGIYIIVKIVLTTYTLALIVVVLTPIVMYVIYGEETMLLPAQLPSISDKTYYGRIILTAFHLTGIYFEFIGGSGSDMGSISLLLNGFVMSELIRNEFDRLENMLKNKQKYSTKQIQFTVRNIILMHRDFRK